MSFFVMAQETIKRKEIGLVFSDHNNFGLTFRTGTDKSLWRFKTLLISGGTFDQVGDSSANKQSHTGFGIQLGKEYRKAIAGNLELRIGVDISFQYSQSKQEIDDKTVNDYNRLNEQTSYMPGINLVFGLNYVFNDKVVIGAELLPNFSYTTGTSVDKYYSPDNSNEFKSDISGFSYGLSNLSPLLSLAYRF
jgi:hypothetical protein